MLSSVLELLPNFKSTYFASMNPPIFFPCGIIIFKSITMTSQYFLLKVNEELFTTCRASKPSFIAMNYIKGQPLIKVVMFSA